MNRYPPYEDGHHGEGYQGVQGYHGVERGSDSRGFDPSGICRPRPEHSAGRSHPDLVWPYLEPGAVSADQCKTLAAGAERDRNDPSYLVQGNGGRGRDGCAGAEGHESGETDCSGEGEAVLILVQGLALMTLWMQGNVAFCVFRHRFCRRSLPFAATIIRREGETVDG